MEQAREQAISRITVIPSFHSHILDNDRELFIYLPASYHDGQERRYSVLYMQDGQHVFHSDAFGGSWRAGEIADRLAKAGSIEEIIVVGIACIRNERLSEYLHAVAGLEQHFPIAIRGEDYERFVIEEVKPYIDRTFRTMPEARHTALMGSSAGGLVSYHMAFRRPDVFGMVGILSPYFVRSELCENDSGSLHEVRLHHWFAEKPAIKVWMDMGGVEGFIVERHSREVLESMLRLGFIPGEDLMYDFLPDAAHTQMDWSARLHCPLLYFFGRVGQVDSLQLSVPPQVGVQGPPQRVYAAAIHDTGFRHLVLDGNFTVSPPGRAEITPDGRILAKQEGNATITWESFGLRTSAECEIVAALPDTVTIETQVEVPAQTPADYILFAPFRLDRVSETLHARTTRVPYGLRFQFFVSYGFGFHEKRETPYRLYTDRDARLQYHVEEW